jgi:hypothetical protein
MPEPRNSFPIDHVIANQMMIDHWLDFEFLPLRDVTYLKSQNKRGKGKKEKESKRK